MVRMPVFMDVAGNCQFAKLAVTLSWVSCVCAAIVYGCTGFLPKTRQGHCVTATILEVVKG